MLPKYHILIGAIFSLLLFFFFKLSFTYSFLFFLSSVLIDVDHYFYYIFNNRNLSLSKAYRFFVNSEKKWFKLSIEERKKYKRTIFYFHGIEFLIPFTILSFIFNIFLPILFGFLLHIAVDLIELYYYHEPLYSKTLQIYVCITNKKKKKLK